jgi:hypothetical protein
MQLVMFLGAGLVILTILMVFVVAFVLKKFKQF